MIEALQFYVSGFWVWLGITAGLWVAGMVLVMLLAALRMGAKR